MIRKKIWNDRTFTEHWEFNGGIVQRHRALNSYPWVYMFGQPEDFTQNHMVRANKQLRRLTQEEIDAFKKAKAVRS